MFAEKQSPNQNRNSGLLLVLHMNYMLLNIVIFINELFQFSSDA